MTLSSSKLKILLAVIFFIFVLMIGYLAYLYQKGGVQHYKPPVTKIDSSKAQVLRDLAVLLEAIEAYYAKNLRYPEGLDQLQPEFIDKIPLEPGIQKPYNYETDRLSQYGILISDPNTYGYKELRVENGKIIKNE